MESCKVKHRIYLLLMYNQYRNIQSYIILKDKMYLDILLFLYQDRRVSRILLLQLQHLNKYCLYFFGMQKIIEEISLSLPALFIQFIFLQLFQLLLHGNLWNVFYILLYNEARADLKLVKPWPKIFHYSLIMPFQLS